MTKTQHLGSYLLTHCLRLTLCSTLLYVVRGEHVRCSLRRSKQTRQSGWQRWTGCRGNSTKGTQEGRAAGSRSWQVGIALLAAFADQTACYFGHHLLPVFKLVIGWLSLLSG